MNKQEEEQLGILNKFWFDTYGQLKKRITDLEQWNSQQRDRIETLEKKNAEWEFRINGLELGYEVLKKKREILEKQLKALISGIAKTTGSYEARIRNLAEKVDYLYNAKEIC